MNTQIIKILDYLKDNEEIAKVLFSFSSLVKNKKETKLWMNEDNKGILKKVKWIYISSFQEFTLVGEDKDGMIVGIDDQCDIHYVQSFQDIPYEMIRMLTKYRDNESTEELFQKYPKYKIILKKYEDWCEENNIKLDKDQIYHDKKGNLFTHYFELD